MFRVTFALDEKHANVERNGIYRRLAVRRSSAKFLVDAARVWYRN